jgi:hypothetical protein
MPRKKAEAVIETQADETPERLFTSDQIKDVNIFQTTMLLGLIASAIQEQRHNMLSAIGNGKLKNNKYNEGYMDGLNDVRMSLNKIIKDNAEQVVTEQTTEEDTNENTN